MNESIPQTVPRVSVTVSTDGSGNVTITCLPNPVPVPNSNTTIGFTLDTAGYTFPTSNAVELDTPNPDFPYPSSTITPTVATLFDLCNTVDLIQYTVNIVDSLTGVAYSVDPEIKNGGFI